MATIDSEHFHELFTLETLPLCDEGMQLAEVFLAACGTAIEMLDSYTPPPKFLVRWAELIQHRADCPDCNEL